MARGVIYHQEVAGAPNAEGGKRKKKKAAITSETCGKRRFVKFPLTRAECVISVSSETLSRQTREGKPRRRRRLLFYLPLQE